MRSKIYTKLNSKDGASISFALFAFIIATVVSLVIVAAALSNVAGLKKEKENEQAYLVADAVAQIITNQVLANSDGTVVAGNPATTKRYVRLVDKRSSGGDVISDVPTGTGDETVFADPFASVLKSLCKSKLDGTYSEDTAPDITVSIADSAPEALKEKMSHTTVTCYITDDYDLDFVISVPTYGTKSYTCKLRCKAKCDHTDGSDQYDIYWESAAVVK